MVLNSILSSVLGYVKKRWMNLLCALVVVIGWFFSVALLPQENAERLIQTLSPVPMMGRSDVRIYGYEVNGNQFVVAEQDSSITLQSGEPVRQIYVELEGEPTYPFKVQVYYAQEGEMFLDEQSFNGYIQPDTNLFMFTIPEGDYENIRVDIGYFVGEQFEISELLFSQENATLFSQFASKVEILYVIGIIMLLFVVIVMNVPLAKRIAKSTKTVAKKFVQISKKAFNIARKSPITTAVFCILIPVIITVLLEWVARGTLEGNIQGNGFFEALGNHFASFFISYSLLVAVYVFICFLSRLHWLATLVVGLLGIIPAVVTHFKLEMRGEPFLPWDLSQIGDLVGVSDSVEFTIPHTIYVTVGIFAVLIALAAFVRVPKMASRKNEWIRKGIASGTALACACALMFGIFLSPEGTKWVGIREDMWMQDRYYRTNGVLTGFLTNLQLLNITAPSGYSEQSVLDIEQDVLDTWGDNSPFFESSYAAQGGSVQDPDIIFLMAEGFWDMTVLNGVEYDRELTPNLQQLATEGALGTAYSPSYGGGTCDVEFEALTGYSLEFLPAGSKPFQQYLTEDTFALPQLLKSEGYSTVAVHGYGGQFWNRDMAYPNLGIDEFIAEEDFVDPDRARGFISDDAMVERMIEELERYEDDGPVFLHGVTMQNHTTYDRNKYPSEELVSITGYPETADPSIIGELEDCATGMHQMDIALGTLVDYLKERERPTILVFWGDHLNPMSTGADIFVDTGYINPGDDSSVPPLHETPLLFWSNFADNEVELGTIATYNIAPVMMELYGMEKPMFYEYLIQQMEYTRGRTRGTTIQPDLSYSYDMTEEQQQYFDMHELLQYDYMFGEGYLEDYIDE